MNKKQRYEEFAKHYAKDGGKVTLSECGICGHLEWVSTYTKEPPEVVVSPIMHRCPICAEAYSRSPEIVNWVLSVVLKSQEEQRDAEEVNRKIWQI